MTDFEKRDRRSNGTTERHAQTVALALITALLVWVGATLQEMYDTQIKQRQAIEGIKTQMDEVKIEVRDVRAQLGQFPTQREIDARFDTLNRRIDNLERARQ